MHRLVRVLQQKAAARNYGGVALRSVHSNAVGADSNWNEINGLRHLLSIRSFGLLFGKNLFEVDKLVSESAQPDFAKHREFWD